MRIVSNFPTLDQAMLPEVPLVHQYLGDLKGWRGAVRFIRQCLRADLVILNTEERILMLYCAWQCLWPWSRAKLVSVDLILRTPRSRRARLKAVIEKMLLKRVHRFILYFKELGGYERFYGIAADRALYVPFKVNAWEKIRAWPADPRGGNYVLCAGRTLRDVRSFVAALERAGCPGVLLQQQPEILAAHGTEAWSGELPPNLKLIIDDGGGEEAFIEYLAQARVVVIPRFRHDIAASGIGTYLAAMALKRCVIISQGPGADDVLTDQAIIVPPEDVDRLAEQITRVWGDDALRAELASRGQQYACSLQGEERLHADLLRASVLSLKRVSRQPTSQNQSELSTEDQNEITAPLRSGRTSRSGSQG
jgi:glycosyltransferase involved in cell wall biosynthesis